MCNAIKRCILLYGYVKSGRWKGLCHENAQNDINEEERSIDYRENKRFL